MLKATCAGLLTGIVSAANAYAHSKTNLSRSKERPSGSGATTFDGQSNRCCLYTDGGLHTRSKLYLRPATLPGLWGEDGNSCRAVSLCAHWSRRTRLEIRWLKWFALYRGPI